MKVVIWEKDVLETIGSLSKISEKFDCNVVSSEEELFNELDDEQLMVVMLDMDLELIELDSVSEKLMSEYPNCKRLLVSERLGPKDFKKHQRSKFVADGYLKRPYDLDMLADILNDFYEDFIKDTPVDMGGKGGTLDLAVEASAETMSNFEAPSEEVQEVLDNHDIQFSTASDEDQDEDDNVQDLFDSAMGEEEDVAAGLGLEFSQEADGDSGEDQDEDDKATMILDLNALKGELGDAPAQEELSPDEIQFDVNVGDDTAGGLEFSVGGEENATEDIHADLAQETQDDGLEFSLGDDSGAEFSLDDGTADVISNEESSDLAQTSDEVGGLDLNLGEDTSEFSIEAAVDVSTDAGSSPTMDMDLELGNDTATELDTESIQNISLDAGEETSDDVDAQLELGGLEIGEDTGSEATLATVIDDETLDRANLEIPTEQATSDLDFGANEDVSVDVSGIAESEVDTSFELPNAPEFVEQNNEIEEVQAQQDVADLLASSQELENDMAQAESPDFATGEFTGAKEFSLSDLQEKPETEPPRDLIAELKASNEAEAEAAARSLPSQPAIVEDLEETVVMGPPAGVQPQTQNVTMGQVEHLKKSTDEILEHHSDELMRLQLTIGSLREDRETLVKKLDDEKESKSDLLFQLNSLTAEIEEIKIENKLLKKRHVDEMEGLRYSLKISEDKNAILEGKNKHYKAELERLNQKVHVNIRKIRDREKQLESQLELLKSDSENIVKTRDQKILELKRKIDSLEFAMESMNLKEKKIIEEKYKLEEKISKISSTLKNTMGVLDDDLFLVEGSLAKKLDDV